MTVRNRLLEFLRDPSHFAAGASDPEVWRAGLDDFVAPALAQPGQFPLRLAQVAAWKGLAHTRAGLVLGPPGTGKTHLLAWLILGYIHARRAANLPCRVFVSAFTLNSIGNLLDGVAARRDAVWPGGPEVWFFGGNAPGAGLSAGVRHQTRLNGAALQDALDVLAQEAVVVGGSVWSLYRLLESGRAPGADGLTAELFDLVCLDEASQVVLAHGLLGCAALKPGGRVVVAGDDRQLPPIRAGREVTVQGRELGGSLYGFLKSAAAPEFALDETFRLNRPLAEFPESAFYPGAYRSAAPDRTLPLRDDWAEGLEDWERVALDPDLPVCVLLHDGPPCATSNPFEAQVAAQLAERLADRFAEPADLWTERLAIVSPHRAQNGAIRGRLASGLRPGAFIDTVDRIQGKERDAVILSYAVADAEFALAEAAFIFASERLNVAITRARSKLIVLVSRRLLDAVPADQDLMDKAELLREFVAGCAVVGERDLPDAQGGRVHVEVRARGFREPELLAAIEGEPPPPALTAPQEALRLAVQAESLANARGGATLRALGARVARRDNLLPDLVVLHHRGHIVLSEPRDGYWIARPVEPPRMVYPTDPDAVAARIAQVVVEARTGRGAPFYWRVRDRFAWMDSEGRDVLLPVLRILAEQGLVQLQDNGRDLTVDAHPPEAPPEPPPEPPPELSDGDFEVLNGLEGLEQRRINFGVFESWTSPAGLADALERPRTEVQAALGRLATDGWVMLADEGRVRSRMAELAREVRYVKQRFAADDAARRPYVVRNLKLEIRDRDKPARGLSLEGEFERVAAVAPGEEQRVLPALARTLRGLWGPAAGIAGFQVRGLEAILAGWRGDGPDSVVVSADTGSGKTEAAALPLIAAVAADRLRGLRGVRAVLAYPRIRLAANQAQRLARYLSALAAEPDMPTVTLGLQFTQVPTTFDQADEAMGWRRLARGVMSFPLFDCPACGQPLMLHEGQGVEAADSLQCSACHWRFDGWIGSKAGLQRQPPDLFLPTTDSLHQWLHAPWYGALFGDQGGWSPPRALLADEIHLYSHVHGAQVGLTLRRLAARAERNAGDGRPALAIGMSATLGDPAAAWGRLIGRGEVLAIAPTAAEREPNPRGREYFFFVQPEAESRGQDVAGASTTVQSLMCLAHGMRRRDGQAGGYRGLVFLDSIDKVRRLHGVYQDAEEIQRLAAFRTRFYPDDPVTGAARDRCCGEPAGCDMFRDGECWWFAANDPRQVGARGPRRAEWPLRVAPQPVTSAATGRVETLIRESDVVFATSSLEVGYDDPDITLVYQQYAPQNLASFIQRKGRGGRGVDDRPITGVTLSLYSPRDSWWFRRPREMIEPAGFETPLNPDNHFVRRGQVLATALDAFARHEARTGERLGPGGRPSAAALAEAEALVRAVFGTDAWTEFDGAATLAALLQAALRRVPTGTALNSPAAVRNAVGWIPQFLFDTINLPRLRVTTPEDTPTTDRREDIALALAATTSGNPSRRFNPSVVHWRPPTQGQGPWLDVADYATAQRPEPFDTAADLLARLPQSARPALAGLSAVVVRPTAMRLATLGVMQGAGWTSRWAVADDGLSVVENPPSALDARRIRHDSRATLRGFPVVKPDTSQARPLAGSALGGWLQRGEVFVGRSLGGRTTGLAMARLYWGADAELKMEDRQLEPAVFSQIFTDPAHGGPALHGYHVQSEGVAFHPDSARLDAFVAAEAARMQTDAGLRGWRLSQLVRFLLEDGAEGLGINAFEARRGADLLATAMSDPAFLPRVRQATRYWDATTWRGLFEDVRAARLSQHPLLTAARVERVATTLADRRLQPVFEAALSALDDPAAWPGWLRTCVLNSLAGRLRDLFVQLGRGDERQVVAHAALPAQFATDAADAIVVCEAGAYGDGTTRAFVEGFAETTAAWVDDFTAACPNAEEDAVVRRAMADTDAHPAWRALDPTDPAALATLGAALGLDPDQAPPAALLRILYGVERIGADRFDLYDLACEVFRIEAEVTAALSRSASGWELSSAAVAAARAEPASPLGVLLAAYESLDDAAQDGSLSGEARLAEQVFRIGAKLCVDGCQACVHHASDLMSDSLAEASTSRSLLQGFVRYCATT